MTVRKKSFWNKPKCCTNKWREAKKESWFSVIFDSSFTAIPHEFWYHSFILSHQEGKQGELSQIRTIFLTDCKSFGLNLMPLQCGTETEQPGHSLVSSKTSSKFLLSVLLKNNFKSVINFKKAKSWLLCGKLDSVYTNIMYSALHKLHKTNKGNSIP